MRVGIERLAVHVPQYVLPMESFAEVRQVPVQKLLVGLGVREMAVTPPWEDAVTLAANAGDRLLRSADVDPNEIGMVLVATETGVDHAKPAAVFVHELLGIGPRCRVYELKHACYSGTAAVMTAADWVRAGGARRRRRALVIATDVARYAPGSPAEPTQGAGAVAMLIGPDPATLELDDDSGTFATQVHDFWRPLGHREAIIDGAYSLACYLNALTGAFAAYCALPACRLEAATLLEETAGLLFHTPFPRMAWKAHRRLVELVLHAGNGSRDTDAELEEVAADSHRRLVAPGLGGVARIGNAYTASLYLCLATLLEEAGETLAGRPLALFSYGSGCCAEFFTGIVPAGAARLSAGLAEVLAARTLVDFDYYERCLRDPGLGGEPPPDATAEFVFRGIDGERRQYERIGQGARAARHPEPAAAPATPVAAHVPVG